MNAGQLKEAEQAFRDALARNGEDADALGGLGLVRLRQGALNGARDLLGRAIAADPAHRSRWDQALAGARAGEGFEAARRLIASGHIGEAEHQLQALSAHGGRDADGALAMLADLQFHRGDLSGAEASWRDLLARKPLDADAMLGLARVLDRAGRAEEAAVLLERAAGTGHAADAGRLHADLLREQASATRDPARKLALLRAAVAADPAQPWATLDLARALVATGERDEARGVMTALVAGPHPSTDALRAAALFAAEDDRPADSAELIARLPDTARTPELRAILEQDRVRAEIQSAMAASAIDPSGARERLLAIAARPDPEGANGAAISRALVQMRDPAGAREALVIAQSAAPDPTPAQRIAYAGALLGAGDTAGASRLVRSLDGATGLSPEQRAALDKLRAGVAVTAADAMRKAGRVADAYDRLAPALARDPSDPSLNLALARLYTDARDPHRALAIDQAVLARDPANADARRSAVQAAIQAGDLDRAALLVREGMSAAPNDPVTWLAAADLDRARRADRRALRDLETARNLRNQQLGTADDPPAQRSVQVASLGDAAPPPANPFRRDEGNDAPASVDVAAMPSGNPFRQSGADDDGTVLPGAAPSPAGVDPMTADIDRQIAMMQEATAPRVTLGPGLRTRTGSPGLDQLQEATLPVEGEAPLGDGRLRLSATPTYLSAGTLHGDTTSQSVFGTGALGGRPAPGGQQAEGVGLDLGYRYKWVNADIGSTPLGFPIENVIGGVEVAPQIADGVHLRVTAERRAVTDSLLSYAGTKDPGTGTTWGGVTRTRGHGQLEFGLGDATFYAGGGYAAVDGTRVASNDEVEAGAGGSYPVWRQGRDELRLGLDLVYFSYDKNLRYFTLGQGGYFSPQSYVASLVPLTYTHADDELKWSVGASLGYQTYHENASPVFPNDPALENALASVPGAQTEFPGKNASGAVGGANGSIEYRLSPSLSVGARAGYQHAGDWSEFSGLLFARYSFQGETR